MSDITHTPNCLYPGYVCYCAEDYRVLSSELAAAKDRLCDCRWAPYGPCVQCQACDRKTRERDAARTEAEALAKHASLADRLLDVLFDGEKLIRERDADLYDEYLASRAAVVAGSKRNNEETGK